MLLRSLYDRWFAAPPKPVPAGRSVEDLAEGGNAEAQFSLGVGQDNASGQDWMQKAADGGHSGAQLDLGRRSLRRSLDRLRSDQSEESIEAYKWFRLSGDAGCEPGVAAWEQISLRMTREQVAEGNRRVLAFRGAGAHPVPSSTFSDPS